MKQYLLLLVFLCLIICICPVLASMPPPEANFTVNTTYGCVNDSFQFNDTSIYSTQYPTAWLWLFGDSQESHIQNPVHSYDTPGVYTVQLWVQDFWGEDWENKTDYITISDCSKNLANFTANTTCDIGTQTIISLNGTCNVPLDKSVWVIHPESGFTIWNGTFWIPSGTGSFSGNVNNDLNATVNFTAYGSYSVSHICNYGGSIGTVAVEEPNYILIGVEGTYCKCNGCCTASAGSSYAIIGAGICAAFGLMAIGLIRRRRKKQFENQ